MTAYRFLQSLDVLYLRGNSLFEGAGAHGDSLMPPWPSVAAGALRSRMLADAGVDLGAYGRGEVRPDDPVLAECLGSPSEPGSLQVATFTVAQLSGATVQACFPLPSDLVVAQAAYNEARYLRPTSLSSALCSSNLLPLVPVLTGDSPSKPRTGIWLNTAGWDAYVQAAPIRSHHLLSAAELWRTDARLGIALDEGTGTAQSGRLYTVETVAFTSDVGFLVGIAGAEGQLPASGLLRLGGDGRGATIRSCQPRLPEVDWAAVERDRRFKLVLSTPGIFRDGWRLPGTDDKNRWHGPGSVSARLVAAAVNRAEVVSGWDLANWRPKAAMRVVPVASVYWLDNLEGQIDELRKLAEEGFWAIDDYPGAQRKTEGFNRLFIAAWPREDT